MYYLLYARQPYTRPDSFSRVIVIPREEFRLEDLLLENGLPVDLPCSQEQWNEFTVHVCESPVDF